MATSENTSTEEMNMSSQTAGGGMPFGDPLAPAEGYEYDYESDLPTRNPFDPLIGLPGIDDYGDIFEDLDPEDNPFGGNPTEGGAGGMDDTDEDSQTPVDSGDDTPMPVEPDGGIGDGAGPIGNDNPFGDGNTDTGEDNENSGSGNSTFGDDNSTNGNGNTSYGDNNQTEGNGNRYFGSGGEGFNELFEGQENPLEMAEGGSDVSIAIEEIGGNIPAFAGGGTPAFEGDVPNLEETEESSNNTVSGNGNWMFGADNETSGNGNWNFGSDSTIEGNGNWNLADNNNITGSGNRPSGSGNTINGNGNQPTGSGNTIQGNRVNTSEDNVDIYGNGDRYFQTDSDGNTELVSDESVSDGNYTFDFSGIVDSDSAYTNTADIDFSAVMTQFPTENESDQATDSTAVTEIFTAEDVSANSNATDMDVDESNFEQSFPEGMINEPSESTNSETNSDSDMSQDDSDLSEQLRNSPFGRLLDIEGVDGAEDIFGNVGGGAGGAGGGDSSFGGGVGDGNPFANWDPLTDGNPFVEGDEPSTENASGSSNNPFSQTESDSGASNPFSQTDSITGEISSSNIDNYIESTKATINDFIDSVGEDSDQPGVIAALGDQYLVRDGEGGFYISSDETVDSDDLLIFGGDLSNSPDVETIDNFIDSMAESSDQPGAIAALGDEYLVQDGEGGWYISADETFDSDDLQVFNGSSIINFSDFEGFNGL